MKIFTTYVGKMAGQLYVLIMATSIPYFIWKDNSFKKSIAHFDPVSELTNSPAVSLQFEITFIIAGILLYCYAKYYLEQSREEYKKFKTFRFSMFMIKFSALGQMGVGIFPRGAFPQHLFASMIYIAGIGLPY